VEKKKVKYKKISSRAAKGKIKRRLKKSSKRKYVISKKISMDDVYRILNRVQMSKKEARFSIALDEAGIIQNVIQDLRLPFDRIDLKTKVTFIVRPGNEEDEEEVVFDIDCLDDEILEEGQMF